MNETISITDILLTVSVGCNLWFLFLLLYERIMDTRIVRFFKGIRHSISMKSCLPKLNAVMRILMWYVLRNISSSEC